MKKIFNVYLGLTLFTSLIFAAKKPAEPALLQIANKPVSTAEFRYVYNKNNANAPEAYTEKNVREYLDLYIKFRLKVKEAEDMGLDTTKSFISELNGYKKQLAQPYLTEKSVSEKLVKEAYDRLKQEVKAAHILIRVSPEAEPKDTLAAYHKLIEIRERILKGENFEALARKYSEDPSAQANGGNLGYFTALQMVYPFEDGAYRTAPGNISMPVRTRFGYHLIKVIDKREAQGEIKVAHIMIRYAQGTNPEDSVSAVNKINEIYSKFQKGEKWETLCNEFSDDFNSKAKGGELPPFSTGNMIPSFEEVAFKLKNAGDVSAPMQTPYGFHIIKLIERKGIQKFEEMEPVLKSKVAKDSRSDLNKIYLISRLKAENKFVENPKAINYIYTKADTTLIKGKFDYNAAAKENKQTLFTINAKKYLVNDFFAYLKTKQKPKSGNNPQYNMGLVYKDFVNESLISYEEGNLEKKYVDYKMLVKEYRDGILLFQLMDTKVWSKAIEDTTGLKKYFESNKGKYVWGRRCDAVIYNAKDKATLDLVKAKLNDKYFDVESEKEDKILYSKGKTDISSKELKKADEILNVLKRDKNYLVTLSASEEKGESATPKARTSKRRLEALVKYLTSKGLDSARIITKDLGAKAPLKGKDFKAVSIKYTSSSFSALEKSLNAKSALTLQVKEAKFQAGEDPVIDSFEWKKGLTEIEKHGRFYLVDVKSIIEPQPKTLEEARGLVISDYQNFLETEWIESLRKKYPVKINEEEIKNLVKK